MDGKGRATDNAFIERFFGTMKRKHIYLNPAENGLELYSGVAKFIQKYNRRNNQGIEQKNAYNPLSKSSLIKLKPVNYW